MVKYNILVHGTLLGNGGIAYHSREFVKFLSKTHNVKFRNFNVVGEFNGYNGVDLWANEITLEPIHHKLLYQQTLYNNEGKLCDFELSGYEKDFKADFHIVMAEANHHYYYQEYTEGIKIAYFPWETTELDTNFLFRLNTYFDYIWVLSQWQYDCMIKQGISPSKLKIVPIGIDVIKYTPVVNKKDNGKFTFLHIGTWYYRKSTYEIVKTFIDLFSDNEDVVLKLSANDKIRKNISPKDELEKYGIDVPSNIIFLDTLTDDEYLSEIQNADVYLSCSRGEGWNIPLMQSIACGIPSVFSKVGGQTEFIEGLSLGVDIVKEVPFSENVYINNNLYRSDIEYFGVLYEPDYLQFKDIVKRVYENLSEYKVEYLRNLPSFSKKFKWETVINDVNSILSEYVSNIFYKVNSVSFGDTLASTPTLRYLSTCHNRKINIVTHNEGVFRGNPYVSNIIEFNSFSNSNIPPNSIVYESFTSAGKADERGIEKKFGHIDIRQLHAMDLGFQLTPENMECDYYPTPMELDIKLPNDYIVLHITNNWPNRTWKYDNWKQLIQWLSERKIFTVLIGFGHRELVHSSISDVPLEKQCPSFDNLYGIDLANMGTMSDMWHVINGAKCLVTMDSGPLHLAGTTDTHIIQLGSAIHPSLRAPYRNESQTYKYDYVGGDCGLFCNSNLLYNVKVWKTINSVPPQTGCLENYEEFKCHPTVSNVIDKLESILNISNKSILTGLVWDGENIRYNFSKDLDVSANIIIRDTQTGFKMFNTFHPNLRNISGYYWMGIAPDKHVRRHINVELYIHDILVETYFIKRDEPDLFYIDNVLVDSSLFKINSNSEDYFMIFWEVFLSTTYNYNGISVDSGDVVLDIGANHGFFTLYSLYRGATKVISVEPMEVCYENIEHLSKTFKKIHPINSAVYNVDGNIEFMENRNASASSYVSGVNYVPISNDTTSVSVKSIHINTLLNSIDDDITLLKLDCEGAEEIIIKSVNMEKLCKIPKIIIEAHTVEILNDIEKILSSVGYKIYVKNLTDTVFMMYCIK